MCMSFQTLQLQVNLRSNDAVLPVQQLIFTLAGKEEDVAIFLVCFTIMSFPKSIQLFSRNVYVMYH